jgi:hypothetical protein
MENESLFKLPVSLLLLDLIGTLLVIFGIMEWQVETNFVPVAYQFENYYFYMMICGFLLMYPLIIYFIKLALSKKT